MIYFSAYCQSFANTSFDLKYEERRPAENLYYCLLIRLVLMEPSK